MWKYRPLFHHYVDQRIHFPLLQRHILAPDLPRHREGVVGVGLLLLFLHRCFDILRIDNLAGVLRVVLPVAKPPLNSWDSVAEEIRILTFDPGSVTLWMKPLSSLAVLDIGFPAGRRNLVAFSLFI